MSASERCGDASCVSWDCLPRTALSSSSAVTHALVFLLLVSVGLQCFRHLPVFGSNVLRDFLWSCLVPYLDSICMSPTNRHVQTRCLEAQVVALALPEGLEDLQCPSSFCAGPKTNSSTKVAEDLGVQQARTPAPGHGGGLGTDEPCKCTQAPSAAVPALGAGSGTKYQARGW